MLEKTSLRFLGLAGEISALVLAWLSGLRLSIRTLSMSWEGAPPPPPPWLTQTLGVGRSGGQPLGSPGGGGAVGTPTYIPQNDPHDTLIILNMRKWGKKINSGSHQPRSDPEVGSGSKSFFVLFIHF